MSGVRVPACSCSRKTASLIIGMRTRFTMNPGVSLHSTGVLPIRVTRASAKAMVSCEVSRPRTTSTSFMAGTGFMKCSPTTCVGLPETLPSLVIDMEEVLLARTVSGLQSSPSCRKRSVLRSWFSGTASMMSWASPTSAKRSIGRTLAKTTFTWSAFRAPFSTARWSPSRILLMEVSSTAGFRSYSDTSHPLAAATCAMPRPIWPAPRTAIFVTSSVFMAASWAFDDDRQRFPAADAEAGQAPAGVPCFQGVQKRRQNASAGCSDGMTQSHGSAVDVDPRGIEPQIAVDGQRHRRECFVDLKEVKVSDRELRTLQYVLDGFHRRDRKPFGSQRGPGVADDAGQGLKPQGGDFFLRHDHEGRRSIVAGGGVPDGQEAVFLEDGLQRPELAQVGAVRRLVIADHERGAFSLRHLNRDDLATKRAGGDGLACATVALEREVVQLGSRQRIFRGAQLAGIPHVEVVVDIPEAILQETVGQFPVAQAVALAGPLQEVGRAGHVFHA